MESSWAYIKETESDAKRERAMILCAEMLLPDGASDHIQDSKNVTVWLQKAIARQILEDLKEAG